MSSDNLKFAIDFIAGSIGGSAQVIVGHPFDTIKVKLQTGQVKFNGPLEATKQTMRMEGMKGFYKGLGAPLATVSAFNAILFTSRGLTENILTHKDGSKLSVSDQVIAGGVAGVAVSFIATPTELLKCRLQAQGCYASAVARLTSAGIDPITVKIYRGPIDVAKYVIQNEGGILGLYRGFNSTLIREIPGNMIMFGVYEALKIKLAKLQGCKSVEQLNGLSLVTAGGFAGAAFWALCYPFDIIKSKIQIDTPHDQKYQGIIDCYKKVYKTNGINGFYKGFVPCMLRSFPANAACFTVYEWVKLLTSSPP